MATSTYYIDYPRREWVDSESGISTTLPSLDFMSVPTWEIHVVNGTTPVDLSSATTWKAAVDSEFDHAVDPMVRTLNSDIDSSSSASGILSVKLDTRTLQFDSKIGSSPYISCYFELCGMDSNDIVIYSMILKVTARNSVDPLGGDPLSDLSTNYELVGGDQTPDPLKTSKTYYIDYDKSRWTTTTGGVGDTPSIKFANSEQWKLCFVSFSTGSMVAVDLSLASAFQVSAHTSFGAASPSVRTLNDSIDSSEKADGILYAIINSNNSAFETAIGSSWQKNAYIEVLGLNSSLVVVASVLLPVSFVNTVDPNGGTIPEPVGSYYNKTESDARYLRSTSDLDIEITDASKGLVLNAGSQRIRLRVEYTDSVPQIAFDVL